MCRAAPTSTAWPSRWRCSSKQRQLRRNLVQPRDPPGLPAQQQKKISPDPFLRLAVIVEQQLLLVEPAIVARAEDVVKIFVVDDRLDEEGRNVWSVQQRMDANLSRVVIVGAEADAAAFLADDLMSPSHLERRKFEEIRAVDIRGQRSEMMVPDAGRQQQWERLRLHPPLLCGEANRGARLIRRRRRHDASPQ